MAETVRNRGGRPRVDSTPITVRLPPYLLAALDAHIIENGRGASRPDWIRYVLNEWLIAQGHLRPEILLSRKMASSSMSDKDERIKALEERFALLRGRLIASYSFVEFILADIYVRAQKLPEYNSLKDKFPQKLWDRINGVRDLLALPGPLDPYKAELAEQVKKIGTFADLRHFLAHGHTILEHSKEYHKLKLRLYKPQPDKTWQIEVHETTIDEIEKIYAELDPYAHAVWQHFKKIYKDLGLE